MPKIKLTREEALKLLAYCREKGKSEFLSLSYLEKVEAEPEVTHWELAVTKTQIKCSYYL